MQTEPAPETMFDELGGAPLLSLLALGIGLLLALSKQLYRVRPGTNREHWEPELIVRGG